MTTTSGLGRITTAFTTTSSCPYCGEDSMGTHQSWCPNVASFLNRIEATTFELLPPTRYDCGLYIIHGGRWQWVSRALPPFMKNI